MKNFSEIHIMIPIAQWFGFQLLETQFSYVIIITIIVFVNCFCCSQC